LDSREGGNPSSLSTPLSALSTNCPHPDAFHPAQLQFIAKKRSSSLKNYALPILD
jgi:hypothetical protein